LKFLIALLFSLIAVPVFAEPLSDRTGMSTSFDVRVDDKTFEVRSTANFDIQSVRFDNSTIILEIKSSIEYNLAEIQIPKNITSGQIRFYVDGEEIPAKILQNDKISFATLEFKGNGTHTLEITSDYGSSSDQPPTNDTPDENVDQILTIIAVVGIVVAVGAGSTSAYYFKTKPKAA
jgi:hypothetical protein